MCGGGGSSSTQQKTDNVTTTTETTIRDIGLTGQNVVDLAAVFEAGAISRTQIQANALDQVVAAAAPAYQAYDGRGYDLVDVKTGAVVPGGGGLQNMAPWIAVAVAVGAVFYMRK
jgi:hypothetical protein